MLRHGIILGTLLAVGLCLLLGSPAHADSSQCYQIQNQDRKNFCLAQAKSEASYCYQVQERDLKNVCLAQSKGEKSYCYQIQDRDLKNQCLSLF